MSKGNMIRKLRIMRIAGKPFIPYSELTQFPFTTIGRAPLVYHYDESANMLEPALPVATLKAEAKDEARAIQD